MNYKESGNKVIARLIGLRLGGQLFWHRQGRIYLGIGGLNSRKMSSLENGHVLEAQMIIVGRTFSDH